jgi:coenzyme F420-reducing hydrogenase delta subunit
MFFYYDKDNNVYETQLDALKSGKKCRFNFHEETFDKVDWTKRPIETLDQLYKSRAEYIRDTNEYVMLCYSGGSDSTKVLETFYYNGIHIDEILVVGAFSQDSHYGSDENHNGDIYHNVYPTLKKLELKDTKVTIVDYTKWFNDPNNFSLIRRYGKDWAKHIGAYRSVHNLFWYDLCRLVPNDKQTAYIMGSDKNCIFNVIDFEKADNPFISFNDIQFADYGCNYKDTNYTRVNFHNDTHETSINLVRKQAHKMLDILRICEKTETEGLFFVNQEEIFKKVVYNLKNPLVFESRKSSYSSFSSRDRFMLDRKGEPMYDVFLQGLETIREYGGNTNMKYIFMGKSYFLT